ncbi:hypothetical protein E2C01_063896 [Portunus trituberculatus]|uniref:Uncharacterized protein n=1 Tax=Portunus trituberculatus TaxID=210409 RepID=A0A5B7HIB2_PORTR|nr:hypothetical protein [Portunus trituberculatus]
MIAFLSADSRPLVIVFWDIFHSCFLEKLQHGGLALFLGKFFLHHCVAEELCGVQFENAIGPNHFSATQLHPLQLVQNEAMQIISGCPRTAQIEVLRAELHLLSIMCRVQEITCRKVSRMLCTGSDFLKGSLTPLYHDPWTHTTPYLRKILGVLTSVGVAEACINVMSLLQPAWNPHHVSVDIRSLHQLFNPPPPMDCDLINRWVDLIHTLGGAGATVHFT